MESNVAAFPRDRHADLRIRISRWLVLIAALTLIGILACHAVGLTSEHPIAEQVNAWLTVLSVLLNVAVCALALWSSVASRRYEAAIMAFAASADRTY